jgi:hypothetical protein
VTHTCNPSYSGGRDQEDRGLKPKQIICETLILKILNTKKSWQSTCLAQAQGQVQTLVPQK